MKKLLMILAIAVTVVSCTKQGLPNDNSSSGSSSSTGVEDRVGTPPAVVAAAFVTNFGNVPVRQWKLRSDGTWRAHFTRNGVAWEATYTAAGVLIKSEASR
ncbi:MAG: hypothetical protein IPP72_13280 [Chitinophagaceae bacterium]|nr:hypothetical protein [Chitinophagaceae bacterium]